MTKNLSRIKKDLKSFAKRVKDFKYTDKVLVMFLLTGTIGIENNLFFAQTTDTAIENQIKQINTSVHNFEQNLKKTKDKNNKSIKQSNLELIQLMEQGDHVIKSTWSNWQYATGENYNDWQGTYKGFGDKNAKYPYEGIFERSLNVYERFVSPSSENYNLLGRSKKLASATGMANGYGLTNINVAAEPLIGFEVSAEINPRNINKPPITISDKTAITPTLPTPISFTPPKPIIKLPVLPNLPKPPSFNIKLGSFCNGMSGGCRSYGTDGGQYNYGTPNTIGIPRPYTVGTIFNLINSITLNDNNPSLTHGWASDFGGHSALFYAYFDVLNQRINGTALLNGNLTITSVNPVQSDASLSSYNKQKFLVGGSRIATLDNVRGGTLKNNATINLIGPLTIGFEVQSDRFFGNDAKTRTLENDGIITDEGEKNSIELDGLLAKGTGTTMLKLAPGLGGPAKIKVSRTSEGFTGYKTGLIMTYEQDDTLSDSKYILKNNNIIKFTGEKSIGIQVFAPGSPSRVEVSNTNNSSITLGGIESYGMKWSSRVADNSTMDNSGTLKISGDAGTKLLPNGTAQIRDSLSSGIAVIEDSSSGSGSSAIRAYNGKVTNNGVINVSGGKGNTGMVLVVNAADDVTNTSNGTINVNSAAGRQNIAMRVDKESVPTDAPGTPKAINGGNIYLDGDSSIGIVGTNADVKNTGNIETTTSKTIINGIGMATRGGVLENSGTINLKGSGVSSNIGVYMVKGTSNPSGTFIIGTDYKTFMLYLSKLTINQDVDLNNTTDAYNHLEIANSSITNAANKTMTGIQANDVAMAQENNKSLYARNKVTLANEGNINLSGTTSTGIYAKFGELHNRATGVITIANKSTAMYGIDDSLLENAGKITVGTNSIAMYSEGSTTQAMKNNGTIELPQTDSVAMSYKPDSTLSSGTVLENAGNIQLTGDKNTAIYAAGTPAYTAKNSGTITLTNSATINNPNVGLYATNKAATLENTGILNIGKNAIGIYGYKAENSGKLNVGNAGIGIYSQNGDVSLTGGKITTGTDEAVGVYTVGTGQNITNTGTAFDIGNNSFGFVNVGTGNKIVSSIANIGLGNKNVYVYSNDTTGFVINSTNITSTGQENYGIYSAGTVTNSGTIDLSSGPGSTATNTATINLNANNTTGIYVTDGATAINNGTIATGAGTYRNVVGVYLGEDSKLYNNGTININDRNGKGVYLKGGTVVNYGNITVNGETDRRRTVVPFTTPDTGKELGGMVIAAPSGAPNATITVNGIPQTPVVINTEARNPISVSASSIGMYVNTSGINFTNAINGLENLTSEADLIIGTEATEITNEKYILINDPKILDTYRNAMANNPNIKWNVYSGSLTWMATPTLELGTNRITSLYMAKVPYTAWAKRETKTDTYNFADGLEQRYGVKALGYREREIFTKLNSIGNNEEILLYQVFDEMMGHQYGNLQQRINATGNTLDKEFKHLQKDWRNPSKQNNKIKVFGMRDEYNTDTAGIIDYTSNAYGIAYVHEDEKIKMGNSRGWYAGAVTNRFKFKDIGKSKENQTILKAGVFKTMSPKKDYNGALQWTIGGDVFVGINDMKRRYLVVDDVFQAKSDYHSYGAALKTDLGYDVRLSERTHFRPYGALKMEYGKFNSIKEDRGEMRLEVKGNDYFSVKPEVGIEFRYVQPLAARTNLTVGLTAAYENELGKVGDVSNKARVRYTTADWFGIRGEKEDRKGNGKFDLNVGVDNTRFGVTVNTGYDTKGNNVRGGIGVRLIY